MYYAIRTQGSANRLGLSDLAEEERYATEPTELMTDLSMTVIFRDIPTISENDMTTELMTYSDMRYELNMLHHRYVVKFVGLLTHPRSFVLEWAPLMSLDSIRKTHSQSGKHLCPCSLYLVLMQVRKRQEKE